ncbi:MAG: protein kinase [Planctomycetes bacterium]|nr:protein kinase [Planctomycetota bacterium]
MADDPTDDNGLKRLERAIDVWLDLHDGTDRAGRDEVLERHPDLRELLDPLLTEADEAPAADFADAEPAPGQMLGEFRLLHRIGGGGMGEVFEALQPGLDRRVALKLLRRDMLPNPRSIARFRREALTIARLEHPGIVRVHAVGEHHGQPWFAMELIDGQPLDHHADSLRTTDRDEFLPAIVRLMLAVCEALGHAHAHGVVHRDIKPPNILVRRDGTPVLTDFGLARELGLPSLTQTGEFAGTPYYTSPEQVRGDPQELGPHSDVFSVGVTLYEVLTRRRPFEGDSSQAVLQQILHVDPRPPEALVPAMPRDLASVVLKALEKEPRRRYADADQMADDLRRFLRHQPVLAHRAGRLSRVVRWVRRDRLRLSVTALLLGTTTALLGLGGYVWLTGPALLAGQRALTLEQADTAMLDAAIIGLDPGTFRTHQQRKPEAVDVMLAHSPRDPLMVCQAAQFYLSRGRKTDPHGAARRCLRVLDSTPPELRDRPALLRVREEALRQLGDIAAADALMPRSRVLTGALEHHLESNALLLAQVTGTAEEGRSEKALLHAQTAVALAQPPRAAYFLQLKRAALLAHNRPVELIAADALARHWPSSVTSWVHKAMSWQGVDDAVCQEACRHCLELRPDNYLGLTILIELAKQRGDSESAQRYERRFAELYSGRRRLDFREKKHR